MANVNKVILLGNITQDIYLRQTNSGSKVCDFSIAVNRSWKDQHGNKKKETTFIDVKFWGRNAEIASEYLSKGSPVYIEGRLQSESWQDKKTGQNRSKLLVQGESLQLISTKNNNGSNHPAKTSMNTFNTMEEAQAAVDAAAAGKNINDY